MATMDEQSIATAKEQDLQFQCEHCGVIMEAPESLWGKPATCRECGEFLLVPKAPLMPNSVVDDFVIKDKVGEGGMGVVYRAHQVSLDRPAAVKVLRTGTGEMSEDAAEELLKEARLAAKLNHPNIVQSYGVGQDHGVFYFAMEFVEGKTLQDVLAKRWKVNPEYAVRVIREVAVALDHAWKAVRLVHRDIKPGNVLISEHGEVKLADLGVAQPAWELVRDESDVVLGTAQYISPEQVCGDPMDFRGDIYSLGAVLYQCVTGHFPFSGGNSHEIIQAMLSEPLRSPDQYAPELPPRLVALILRMMAKEPDDRFQDLSALVDELGQVHMALKGSESTAIWGAGTTPAVPAPATRAVGGETESMARTRQPSRRLKWMAIALAILTIPLAAVLVHTFLPAEESARPAQPVKAGEMAGVRIPKPTDPPPPRDNAGPVPTEPGPTSRPALTGDPVKLFAEFPESGLVVRSILPNPEGRDDDQELVMLQNLGTDAVDMTGWYLTDDAGKRHELMGEITGGGTHTVSLSTKTVQLNNSGDSVSLVDAAGTVRHRVEYGGHDVRSGRPIQYDPLAAARRETQE